MIKDILQNEINNLKEQLRGEKLLSEKRRKDGIEMMLENKKLKEAIKVKDLYILQTGQKLEKIEEYWELPHSYDHEIIKLDIKQILSEGKDETV